jgi:competence ComEA-like helix-hairpin-helix protein
MKIIFPLLIALACVGAENVDEGRALPDGLGKEIAAKVCIDCHDSGNFRRARFSADQWADSVADMVDRGAKVTPAEIETLVAYLAKNFGPGSPVLMNTAPLAEMKAVLGFTVDECRAIIDYREKNGAYRSAEDLVKAPGVDAGKVAAKKSMMVF